MVKNQSPSNNLTISAFQLNSNQDIDQNKQQILALIADYKPTTAADVWAFPECALFRNLHPTDHQAFLIDDTIIPWFRQLAIKFDKWILVGSFFQQHQHKQPTNTSVVINPKGHIVETYDKIHLFDVNVHTTNFSESAMFSAGDSPTTVDIHAFKCGLSICFDIRFPELYAHYRKQQCDILFIPSSFTASTGKLHWHTLCKARAIETQCVVIAPNQCGVGSQQTLTYGHSLIVDSLGNIVAEANGDSPEVITATISRSSILNYRQRFPLRHLLL